MPFALTPPAAVKVPPTTRSPFGSVVRQTTGPSVPTTPGPASHCVAHWAAAFSDTAPVTRVRSRTARAAEGSAGEARTVMGHPRGWRFPTAVGSIPCGGSRPSSYERGAWSRRSNSAHGVARSPSLAQDVRNDANGKSPNSADDPLHSAAVSCAFVVVPCGLELPCANRRSGASDLAGSQSSCARDRGRGVEGPLTSARARRSTRWSGPRYRRLHDRLTCPLAKSRTPAMLRCSTLGYELREAGAGASRPGCN